MRATVQKWGNSLALRIPSGLAEEARLREGVEVELAVEGDRLVIAPVAAPAMSLTVLLAGITPQNVHGEQFADGARGGEAR